MSQIDVRPLSVRRIFDWFDQRCLAVPEMQREFVWNAQRACSLLDSIYKGYPVGTAMIWRTGREKAWLLRHTLHVLPPFDPVHNREIFFLIDGQQRLSVLHQVRRGETIRNSNGREIRFGDICFSLREGDSEFVYLRRPDPAQHFRVSAIVSARWRATFRKLPAYKRRRIQECRARLLDYHLIFLFVSASELADVRETFIRINTQGLRITEADRAFTSASRVKPLHRYRQLCEQLPDGFRAMDKAVYWTTLVLARGIQDLGQNAFARLTREIDRSEEAETWFERHEPRLEESIKLAADHLVHRLGVFDFKLLPYENMIAMLALFFYWNNRAQPNRHQREQIRRWFWHTAVLKRYAGSGYRRHILDDARFFKDLGRLRRGTYRITDHAPADALVQEDYRRTSALSAAFQLMLTLQKPRYLTNGEEIPLGPVAAPANRKELHHIWPRDLLRRRGVAQKRCNSLCNICYLVAHDNRSFGSQAPYHYLDEFRYAAHFVRAMRSHLIRHDASAPIWDHRVKRGFRQFVELRNENLKRAMNKMAGFRLFETA